MTKRVAKTAGEVVIDQEHAQRVVGDPAIREAFEAIKDAYLDGWKQTKPDEVGKRETAYAQYKAVADVWGEIERRARGAQVRSLREQAAVRAKPGCQGCGAIEGEKHLPNCPVLAAHLRTQALANG